MPKKTAKNRYMLIDGNALVHRGYHAVPALTNKDGEHTNAVYGFAMILLRAIKDLKPTHIACSFDLAGPTFRDEMYADYKGTRVKGDDELYMQFPRIKELVRALNIPIFEIEGFEADDVLGTLATHICEKHPDGDCEVMIATGDLDSLQLVNECVKIYTLRKGINDTAVYDIAAVKDRYGLAPKQMIDYKALRGDPSDNIKGVKGIGEKTAGELIQNFGMHLMRRRGPRSRSFVAKICGDWLALHPTNVFFQFLKDSQKNNNSAREFFLFLKNFWLARNRTLNFFHS